MFSNLIHSIKSASTVSAKVVVGATGGLVGGAAGLVAGTVVGATLGTVNGCKAGCEMALSMVWPKDHQGQYEAEELVNQTKADIKAEICQIEQEIRDLAGPASKPKRGRGRPRKNDKITIDYQETDSQEVRDYMASKGHLKPDPIF